MDTTQDDDCGRSAWRIHSKNTYAVVQELRGEGVDGAGNRYGTNCEQGR